MTSSIVVCSLAEIPDDGGREFLLPGFPGPIAVFRHRGRLYALDALCSHARVPLADGDVRDGAVQCPRHASRFDLTSGEALCLPARRPVRTYRVHVTGDLVRIDLPESA